MTRKETKQCIAVMQAYADGKQLELFDKYKNEWVDVVDLTWNWYESEYRIKPTLSYRPFHNVEECWKEMQKHRPFGIMSSKNSKDYMSFFYRSTTKAATSAATKAKTSRLPSTTSNSPTAHPSESKWNNKINIC